MASSIITYLEMRAPGELRLKRCADERFSIGELVERVWRFNRNLYQEVGRPWAWTDKSGWTDDQWRAYVESDRLRTFLAVFEDETAGYYELQRDEEGGVEIIYFGLLPGFIGKGFGGALLTDAIEEAWAMRPTRVWVHTCTEDHPAAVANYEARGMKVYKKVECGR